MTKRRGNGSGKLKDEHKAFLVQRLAVFDSPKQAAEALMAEFGIELTPQGVEAYDPTKCAGHALRERWRTVFWTVRESFLAEFRRVPESHKAVRVKMLARAADVFKDQSNYLAMADMLEQIAKEMGDVYSSHREPTYVDPVPLAVSAMSEEEVDRELDQLFAKRSV